MKILDFGSINLDFTYQVDHHVKTGETITSLNRTVFPGGKGYNQAVALGRAGAEGVFFACRLGKDGDFLIPICRDAGVDTRYMEITDLPTGQGIIQLNSEGDNCIILFPSANRSIDEEFADRVLEGFTGGDLLLLQNEISSLSYIIDRAFEKGMRIVMNPSPFDFRLKECDLTKIGIFRINETEGNQLTGKDDPEEILDALKQLYPETEIILTLGEKGSIYSYKDKRIYQRAYEVVPVDTTAAGDTFTGYYLASLLKGLSIEECLDTASKASAMSVTVKGAIPSIPLYKDVMASDIRKRG